MFMLLMDGIAWLVVIGLGFLALMFASALLGNILGRRFVACRDIYRKIFGKPKTPTGWIMKPPPSQKPW